MSIRMVRQPSNTPNINNIDDIIPFRYAYGNQNGYVIGKGNELSYSINGSEFKINSGRVVLQGVESDIDANGVAFVVDTASSTKQYYTVYYKVNLATDIVTIETKYDIAGYPIIDKGDDLTKTTSGYAILELYHFDVENGVISNVNKLVKAIEYSGTALVGYDIGKGTVEERLNALGFKEGVADYSNLNIASVSVNSLKKQGKYVIFNFETYEQSSIVDAGDFKYITIPQEFVPKESVTIPIIYTSSDTTGNQVMTTSIGLESGNISFFAYINTGDIQSIKILNAGWETD